MSAVDLLAEVGLPTDVDIRIETGAAVLASRFPIGARAAEALAACGAAAAILWRDRAGTDQSVRVEQRRAEASLISFLLQRLEGAATPRSAEGMALVALYECGDGRWIHLHGAFPQLAQRTVQVIGGAVGEGAIEVATRVKQWNAQQLEDALAEVGACGAMVRSFDEWVAHPQRAALAPLGRVSVEKIADGPVVPVGDGSRPLGGVRALDLTRVLAGPTAGRVLAEHGADVLHVNGDHLDNVPAFVMDTSHGKRSTSLDLNNADHVEQLRGLVRDADVFTQGYRGESLARRGFGFDGLVAQNPSIIAVTINCYGDVGPWRTRPGWEQLSQSVTGIAHAEGAPGPPRLIPAAAADYTTGYLAALGTMAALRRRSIEGGAYRVRASLCQTAMWIGADGPTMDPSLSEFGDASPWQTTTHTGFGELTHLSPVAQLSATPARWDLPSPPLGTHPPVWV